MRKDILILVTLCIFTSSTGLEYNNRQQRYNPSSDFLLHETSGKKGDVASPSSNPTLDSQKQSPGKRDYISQFPPLGVQSTPSPQPMKPTLELPGTTQKSQSTPGKRDYVAPQLPITKPSETTGKVKDLVNFYDSQNKAQTGGMKTPSYSSILQSSSGNNSPTAGISTSSSTQVTQSTSNVWSTRTPKPISFSAVVAGNNKPSTPSTMTTLKPHTRPFTTPLKPAVNSSPSHQPATATPILPSSIVNSNRNNNQINNRNVISDVELQTLSEELLRKDTNNAAKLVTVNYQEKTTSQAKDDKAPQPLFVITPEVWNIPTIQKFVPLLDNYERDTLVNEYVTPQERNEENAFMDVIMTTSVIRHLMNFLKDKGFVTPDPRQQRDFLKQLWFSLYSRGKGKISSSGFEHIFVSELKNGDVSGLHNWIYFSKEESANRINYLGYLKYIQLNDKGAVLKLHFNQQGADKPVDTMFVGTSPELEIALYTLCFVTRADNDCKLKLGSKDVEIVTHTFRYRSKNLIGSAYPQI